MLSRYWIPINYNSRQLTSKADIIVWLYKLVMYGPSLFYVYSKQHQQEVVPATPTQQTHHTAITDSQSLSKSKNSKVLELYPQKR